MKLRALVVESAKYFRQMLQEIMSTIGVECHAFETGELGLQAIAKHNFDFILVSRHMQDMGGEVFLHRARETGDVSSALTILLTSDEVAGILMEANAVGYKIVFNKKDINALQDFLIEVVNSKMLNLDGRILFIEDQMSVAQVTMSLFSSYRTKIDHVTSVTAAKEALEKRNYDLIMSDYNLDNNETAEMILDYVRDEKEMDKSRLPILVVSSEQNMDKRINLLKNGANDFIGKPFHGDELIVRASNLITTKKLFDHVKMQQKELMNLAMTDQLTGLYNRRSLFEIGPKYLSDAKRHRFPLSLLVIDLDHFKNINDTLGHAAGDAVLKAVGHVLNQSCRTEDFVARFGGEEFVMLLSHCDLEQAVKKAEEIRKTIFELEPDKVPISASIGVAELKSGDDFDVLFNEADAAVYEAKETGRNRVVKRQR